MEIELYNLREDPQELQNRAKEFPEIIGRMERHMKKAHTPAALEVFQMRPLGD